MKLAVATIFLLVAILGAQAAPQSFNFGGMTGQVDAMQVVNGEKVESNPEINRKAEEVIKGLIYKHLSNKKQAKKTKSEKLKAAKDSAKAVAQTELISLPQKILEEPEPILHSQQIPSTINWDDHPESKAMLDEKIPGGTAAVDALIKLLQKGKADY